MVPQGTASPQLTFGEVCAAAGAPEREEGPPELQRGRGGSWRGREGGWGLRGCLSPALAGETPGKRRKVALTGEGSRPRPARGTGGSCPDTQCPTRRWCAEQITPAVQHAGGGHTTSCPGGPGSVGHPRPQQWPRQQLLNHLPKPVPPHLLSHLGQQPNLISLHPWRPGNSPGTRLLP